MITQIKSLLPVQADFTDVNGAETLAPQIYLLQCDYFCKWPCILWLIEDTPVPEMDKLWHVHVQNPDSITSTYCQINLAKMIVSYCLFIGSIWGEAGSAGEAVYSAVKGAQHAFVKSYAKEVAFNNIRVNAIAPGLIETEMNNHLTPEEKIAIF